MCGHVSNKCGSHVQQPRAPSQDITSPERNAHNGRIQQPIAQDRMEGKRASAHHHKHKHHHHHHGSKTAEKPSSSPVQNLMNGVRDFLKQHLAKTPTPTTEATPVVAAEPRRNAGSAPVGVLG